MHWLFSSGWNWLISPDSEWSFLPDANSFKQVGKERVSFYKDEFGNDMVFEGGIFELEIKD